MGSAPDNRSTLYSLLCLSHFKKLREPTVSDGTINAITEWAEYAVMAGNRSESLLILASLNLDKTPDVDEVYYYLDRFMQESGLRYPGDKLSALVWLRITLRQIADSPDAQVAEERLHYFTTHYLGFSPHFFTRACDFLSGLYFYLFDNYGYLQHTLAEEMKEDRLLAYIEERVNQIEKKLLNKDWIAFLSGEVEVMPKLLEV